MKLHEVANKAVSFREGTIMTLPSFNSKEVLVLSVRYDYTLEFKIRNRNTEAERGLTVDEFYSNEWRITP